MKLPIRAFVVIVCLLTAVSGRTATADGLYESFQNPPTEAKPFVRWWWNGNCITKKEILRELDVMKEAGIGGVEINPIAMPPGSKDIGAKPVEWLSSKWNRLAAAAVEGAKERGMKADMIVGSGWPFGGRFLDWEDTIEAIGVNQKVLKGPGHWKGNVRDLIKSPHIRFAVENAPDPKLRFVRLVPEGAEGIEDCLDVTEKVQADGTLELDLPAGEHTLYVGAWRQGFTAVMHGAPGADGPVLDHMNRSGVRRYLERMSKNLGPALGGELGDGLRAIFCDSIELSGVNWTDDFAEEFEQRRGYDLEPWLQFALYDARRGYKEDLPDDPEFAEAVRRVRYDFNRTFVELFHERFIRNLHSWCHNSGVQSRYQAYGYPGLMGMLGGYMIPDIPEGDTWLYQHGGKNPRTLDHIRYEVWNKYASSGAHLSGRSLVGCEAMTNTRGVFLATLEYVKQATDINIVTGINHSILHGFNYSPPEAGFPGWMRYGTYFNEHNPWWPYFEEWAKYHARLSAVFQSAEPQAEVAILGPTPDVWAEGGVNRRVFMKTPWYIHDIWQTLHQNGYDADYVNGRVLQDASFDGGKLRYGPMAYETLVVTEVHSMEPATAEAITRLAKAGGTVIFVGNAPDSSAGLHNADANDRRVRDSIRAALKAGKRRVRVVSAPEKGKMLEWTRETMGSFGVEPPVRISKPDLMLFQVHARQGKRQIFFFTNQDRERTITFDAHFATGNKTPWRWDPETGERSVYPHGDSGSSFQVSLKPLHSLLLVFEPELEGEAAERKLIAREDYQPVGGPWKVTLNPVQGAGFSRMLPELVDLGKSEDESLNTFGGVAVYRTEFYLDDTDRTMLDLGEVYDVSDVTLNGKHLGVRWWGEHIYDAGDALREGTNVLEIRVPTVLFNYCRALEENPTAQRWVNATGRKKPVSAGLVGPVRLYATD